MVVTTTKKIATMKTLLSIQRGFFMRSVIDADTGATCRECNSVKFIKVQKSGFTVSVCKKCKGEPNRYRIRRWLPSDDGLASRIDIRYDSANIRIKDFFHAASVCRAIDTEIQEKRFDVKRYAPRKVSNASALNNFIDGTYWPAQLKKCERGELTPSSLKIKRVAIGHIKEFFQDLDIRILGSASLIEFYENFSSGDRARVLAMQELRVILNYANALERIEKVPKFPKLRTAKKRNVERFLEPGDQLRVIEAIENQTYKAMVKTLIIYALRPSEVRAIQWRDIDRRSGVLLIQRHFSNGTTLIDGRKSNESAHVLPLVDDFLNLINEIPRGQAGDFIFKGVEGGAVGDRVLARAWSKACELAGVQPVQLYEGTRHSRLSALKGLGYSNEQLLLLSGHTSTAMLERYAQTKTNKRLSLVQGMIQ